MTPLRNAGRLGLLVAALPALAGMALLASAPAASAVTGSLPATSQTVTCTTG